MVRLGDSATRQISDLIDHYDAKERPEASLTRAVSRAIGRIGQRPESGVVTPRPYSELAEAGVRRLKEGRYWFAYSMTDDPVILAVIHDQANVLRRL